MDRSVVIDTGFLISLGGSDREGHASAKAYYKYFLQNKIRMLLPTVVIAEFAVKEDPSDIPLHNFVMLPFNYNDAVCCAALDPTAQFKEMKEGSRPAVKDDFKIIAQACVADADFLITEDRNTMGKYCARLNDEGRISFSVIPLSEPFDVSFVNNTGQTEMDVT